MVPIYGKRESKMKLELDIGLDLLEKLKNLDANMSKYPFVVLTTEEEAILRDLLFLLFDKVSQREEYLKRLSQNEEKTCKCGHTLSYHSLMSERICCRVDCQCMQFEEKPIAQA
jgi:hypothetical protein